MEIIAFGHKEGVGKDTAGKILVARGYTRVYFAEGVYEICGGIQRALGVPVEKDPQLLQTVGHGLKAVYGADVWVRRLRRQLREHVAAGRTKFVITDLRHQVEMDYLRSVGAKLIKLERDGRVLTRDPTHISEIELDGAEFDHVVENNGTVESLAQKIYTILEKA